MGRSSSLERGRLRLRAKPVDGSQHAIAQFSGWITNADTKAALLVTATTLVAGGVASQADTASHLLPPHTEWEWLSISAFSMTMVSVLVSAIALTLALRPRIFHKEFSRYSWPAMAGIKSTELEVHLRGNEVMEAWRTAHALARIAKAKYRWVNIGLIAWTSSAAFFLTWNISITRV